MKSQASSFLAVITSVLMLLTVTFDCLVLCHNANCAVSFKAASVEGECIPFDGTDDCSDSMTVDDVGTGGCVNCVDIPITITREARLKQENTRRIIQRIYNSNNIIINFNKTAIHNNIFRSTSYCWMQQSEETLRLRATILIL